MPFFFFISLYFFVFCRVTSAAFMGEKRAAGLARDIKQSEFEDFDLTDEQQLRPVTVYPHLMYALVVRYCF